MNKVSDFLVNGKWTCVKCGACCSWIEPLVKNGKMPKEFLSETGACKNLDENNMCKIYDSRPDICRIDITLKGTPDKEIAKMCKSMKDWKGLIDGTQSRGASAPRSSEKR